MNPIEKKYAKSAQKMIIFESGLAILEMPQARVEVLYERMAKQYKMRLEEFNPVSEDNVHHNFNGKSFAFTLCDAQVKAFKKFIEDAVGKKMWKIYTNLKSELVNHWLPHFKVQSGEDVDNTVERVWMHAWGIPCKSKHKKEQQKGRVGRA